MEVIKFRQKLKPAYCKNTEPFHYWGFIDDGFHSPASKVSVENYENSDQYTGLKDKNGTEIYEGDIIEYEEPVADYRYMTCKALVDMDCIDSLSCVHWNHEECEVLGNIHENPELLENNNE